MELNIKNVGIIAGALLLVFLGTLISTAPTPQLGSVNRANEYHATSTAASTAYGAFTASRLISSEPGALGSVVVTGANTGIINFYDATTTNISLRGGKSTSSIHMVSIPASMAAGTYTFDTSYNDGLYIDIVSGNAPTTTITYR